VLKFRAVRPLSPEEWALAKQQSLTDDAKQAIEFKMVPSKASSEPALALPATFSTAPAPAAAPTTTAEPIKRPTKKPDVVAPTKDVAAILENWGSDDE
jgi:hypothetical protein